MSKVVFPPKNDEIINNKKEIQFLLPTRPRMSTRLPRAIVKLISFNDISSDSILSAEFQEKFP